MIKEAGQQPQLADYIAAEVVRLASEDALRVRIGEHIAKTVDEAIRNAFHYGDANKQITKAVQEALAIEGRINLPSFGNTVMALLRQKLDETVNTHVAKCLDEEMSEILSLAPKEVKLSGVVKAMIADLDQHDRYGTYVTCIVEKSDVVAGYYSIYLDEEPDVAKYSCDTRIQVDSEGRIYALTMDRKDVKKTLHLGGYGWRKPIFTAYCCRAPFIVDEEFVSTGIGDF